MKELLTKEEIQALAGITFSSFPTQGVAGSLDAILEVPVTITVGMGRAQLPIRSLLNLSGETVIELDRDQGMPVNVYANGMLIAHGRLLSQNGQEAVRITRLLGPEERARLIEAGGCSDQL